MAGKAVFRKLSAQFGAIPAHAYLYGNSERSIESALQEFVTANNIKKKDQAKALNNAIDNGDIKIAGHTLTRESMESVLDNKVGRYFKEKRAAKSALAREKQAEKAEARLSKIPGYYDGKDKFKSISYMSNGKKKYGYIDSETGETYVGQAGGGLVKASLSNYKIK